MVKPTDPAKKYNSNPFTLAFDALGRLFKTNLMWAIILLIFGFFGASFQFINQVGSPGVITTQDKVDGHNLSSSIERVTANIDPSAIAIIAAVTLLTLLIISVVGSIIQTFLTGMFAYVMNQSEQNKSVTFSEAFSATTKRFWRLFWASILANIKIFLWTLLLIIPGIIAALRYSLLPYLIMSESEKEKGIIDSHNKTKAIVKGRLWEVFGVGTVSVIIPFIGGLVGLVGRSALYRQLQHSHDHKTKKPKIHWLNYLGLLLLGLLILFIGFIISIALIIAIAAR